MPNCFFAARVVAPRWIWASLCAICVAALWYSLDDLVRYGGIDLRNRVVGARALLLSIDPYHVEWRPGAPIELADTHQRYPGVTRVIAAPPLLLLYMPFAKLPYQTQQAIWWALQWAALAVSIAVLARSFADDVQRRVFVCVAVVCFVGSWFWRLHVERGQYYVFSTMLLCMDLAVLRRVGRRPFWLGIPSGVAVAIKPTNVIVLPMLWLFGERRAALACAAAAVSMVAASVYVGGPEIWLNFLAAVKDYGEFELDPDFENRRFGPVQAVAPGVIEGANFQEALPMGRGSDEIIPSTLVSLLRKSWTFQASRIALAVLLIAGPLIVLTLKRGRTASRDAVLLWMAFVLAAVDFLRPLRWAYVDIAFLPIAAFSITTMPRTLPFAMLASLAFVSYLGPFESKWAVLARHVLTAILVLAIIASRLLKPVKA
jgi:hypothetical protein